MTWGWVTAILYSRLAMSLRSLAIILLYIYTYYHLHPHWQLTFYNYHLYAYEAERWRMHHYMLLLKIRWNTESGVSTHILNRTYIMVKCIWSTYMCNIKYLLYSVVDMKWIAYNEYENQVISWYLVGAVLDCSNKLQIVYIAESNIYWYGEFWWQGVVRTITAWVGYNMGLSTSRIQRRMKNSSLQSPLLMWINLRWKHSGYHSTLNIFKGNCQTHSFLTNWL
jgi:hypothetical protein